VTKVAFGTFTFDSGTRELLDSGRRVHLSPKAFDLLQLLVERRPAVVSKADILGRVWTDAFVSDANLSVVVAEIRQALGDDSKDARYVRTVHRVGYAFSAQASDLAAPLPGRGAHRCWLAWNDQTFLLAAGENLIGRDPRCAVWVDASGVSRRHARIVVADGEATIEDLESSNGTYVGGRRLKGRRALSDRESIELGSATLTFREWSDERPPKTERMARPRRR
jgi:DNA-binding winged helix-turn-helix (wHTH) protein